MYLALALVLSGLRTCTLVEGAGAANVALLGALCAEATRRAHRTAFEDAAALSGVTVVEVTAAGG